MQNDLNDLLFHPGRFFERKTAEKPDYGIPVLIVGAGWIISLLSPFVAIAFFPGKDPNNILAIPPLFWLLLSSPFTTWILLSLGLFGLSRVFSGSGTFMATLCNAGYGMLPITLIAVLEMVTSPLASPKAALAISPGTALFILCGRIFLSLLLVLWSGYLWIHAVEKTHVISRRKAIIAAGFVTFFFIFWKFAWTLMILLQLNSPGVAG